MMHGENMDKIFDTDYGIRSLDFPVGPTRYTSSHASCGQDSIGSHAEKDICIHAADKIFTVASMFFKGPTIKNNKAVPL
jgi:hypothetical protein